MIENNYYILVDFGSTYTKSTLIDKKKRKVIYNCSIPSSVDTDASITLFKIFDLIEKEFGSETLNKSIYLASSSAAGGLRMSVVGLTEMLSLTAAKNVAFGAGAKIVKYINGKVNIEDINDIKDNDTEILLITGGYDGGNEGLVKNNIDVLAESDISIPIVYAGNSDLDKYARYKFSLTKKEFFISTNIIPKIGEINTKECSEIIRNIFMNRIINMKGLGKVSEYFDSPILPTPAVILSAGEMLSTGTTNKKGLGELMIIDVGGATTDIHSYCIQIAEDNSKIIGALEPFSKRTVEGDLGMRESSDFILKDENFSLINKDYELDYEYVTNNVNKRKKEKSYLSKDIKEKLLDDEIARLAVYKAVRRHAGKLVPSAGALKFVQIGKNIKNIKTIIGTGGQIIHSKNQKTILKEALKSNAKDNFILLPDKSDFYVDNGYLLYASGLLREVDIDLAFDIVVDNLMKI